MKTVASKPRFFASKLADYIIRASQISHLFRITELNDFAVIRNITFPADPF